MFNQQIGYTQRQQQQWRRRLQQQQRCCSRWRATRAAASDDTWRTKMKCAFPGPTATRCCSCFFHPRGESYGPWGCFYLNWV